MEDLLDLFRGLATSYCVAALCQPAGVILLQ